jgi:DNA-binding CsgD family transcriptional regulator
VEVLSLLARGLSAREAAGCLSLSPATVRSHARRARLKLGADSRTGAIASALRAGRLETEPLP